MITPAEYWDMLKKHDWTYMMSDDGSVYRSGKSAEDRLKAHAAEHEQLSAMYDAFRASVWEGAETPERPLDGTLTGQLALPLYPERYRTEQTDDGYNVIGTYADGREEVAKRFPRSEYRYCLSDAAAYRKRMNASVRYA